MMWPQVLRTTFTAWQAKKDLLSLSENCVGIVSQSLGSTCPLMSSGGWGLGAVKAAERQSCLYQSHWTTKKSEKRSACLSASLFSSSPCPCLSQPTLCFPTALKHFPEEFFGKIVLVPPQSLNFSSAHSVLHERDRTHIQGLFGHRDCAGALGITSWAFLGWVLHLLGSALAKAPGTAWVATSSGTGPLQGSTVPVSIKEQFLLVGTKGDVGLAPSFGWCCIFWMVLCGGAAPCRPLSTQLLGLGRQGVFQSLHQFCLLLYSAALQHF